MSMPPVLFIDLDDTLVNSTKAYDLAMSRIGIDPADVTYLEARKTAKAKLPILSPQSRSRFLYFKAYLDIKGNYTPEKHLALSLEYEKNVVEILSKEWIFLERKKLFLELKKNTRSIYVVTNETTRLQVMKMAAFDPNFELFNGLVTSEEVGLEKPARKIFDYALELSGVSDPAQVIMVGDSFENDVEPALGLGMKAILTTEFKVKKQKESKIDISSINNLNQLLGFMV